MPFHHLCMLAHFSDYSLRSHKCWRSWRQHNDLSLTVVVQKAVKNQCYKSSACIIISIVTFTMMMIRWLKEPVNTQSSTLLPFTRWSVLFCMASQCASVCPKNISHVYKLCHPVVNRFKLFNLCSLYIIPEAGSLTVSCTYMCVTSHQ